MAFPWSERPRSNDSVDSTKLPSPEAAFSRKFRFLPESVRSSGDKRAQLAALIYWPDSAGSSRSDIKPIKRGVTSKIAKVTDSFLTIASFRLRFRFVRSFSPTYVRR